MSIASTIARWGAGQKDAGQKNSGQKDSGQQKSGQNNKETPEAPPRSAAKPEPENSLRERNDERPDVRKSIHSLGLYHESLRTRCESVYTAMDSFRGVADEIDLLFGEFGAMATRFQQQTASLKEHEALVKQLSGITQNQAASLNAAQNANSELSAQITALKEARAASDSHAQAQDETIRNLQADLKDALGKVRVIEMELSAARSTIDTLTDESNRLGLRLKEAEKTNGLLTEERRRMREQQLFDGEEHAKLTKAYEEIAAAASLRKRELLEAVADGEKLRKEISGLEQKLAQNAAEADALRQSLHVSQTAHQDEVYAINLKSDAMRSRVRLTEQLLQTAREEARSNQDQLAALDDLRHRLQRSEAALDDARKFASEKAKTATDLEQSRDALLLRCEELSSQLRERQTLNDQAADRIQSLQEAALAMEAKKSEEAKKLRIQIAKLTEQLEKERSERAYIEGALQIARRDRTQLQGVLFQNKTSRNASSIAVVQAEAATQRDVEELQGKLREAPQQNVDPLHSPN